MKRAKIKPIVESSTEPQNKNVIWKDGDNYKKSEDGEWNKAGSGNKYDDTEYVKYAYTDLSKLPQDWKFTPRTGDNATQLFSWASGDFSRDLDLSNVTSLYECFSGYKGSVIDLKNVTFPSTSVSVNEMFNNSKAEKIIVAGKTPLKPTEWEAPFSYCTNLTYLDLSGVDTTDLTYFAKDFSRCTKLTDLILGESFGYAKVNFGPDFQSLTNWTNDTVKTSLFALYDRAANGLPTLTITLSANTYNVLSEDDIATLTARGYSLVHY